LKEEVRKELDTIFGMIQGWKNRWLEEYRDPADYPDMDCNPNAWILDEVSQLIFGGDYYQEGMVSAYIDRMKRAKVLTSEEHTEFVGKIYDELDDMRRLLGLPDPKEKIIAFDK